MRRWLQYLLKEDGRSGYVQNNIVSFAGTKRPLVYSALGWQEIAIAWERNMDKHGLTRNFSLPFSFPRDGGMIVRDALYRQSVEEKLFLLIQQLTLVIEKTPTAIITPVTGTNPFTVGINEGTISDTPGKTVYVKAYINGAITDELSGSLNGELVSIDGTTSPVIYTIVMPASGFVNYEISLVGAVVAGLTVVNSIGGVTPYYKWLYKYFYKGELDLSKAIDDLDKISVPIMEGGLSKMLKAHENTVWEIEFDEDAIDVYMDGIEIDNKMNFLSVNQLNTSFNSKYGVLWLQVFFLGTEGTIVNGAGFDTLFNTAVQSPIVYTDNTYPDNYFFKASADMSIRFRATVSITIDKAPSTVELYIKNSNGTRTSLFTIVNTTGQVSQTFIIDQIVPLIADEQLYLLCQITNDDGVYVIPKAVIFDEFEFSIEFKSTYAPSYIKAFTKLALYRKLVEKITGNASYAKSLLLEGNTDLCITCGDAIRGIPGAKIKTKYSDFVSNADCILMAGQGIENDKIALEAREHFYDPSDPIDLGEAKDWAVSYADDVVSNTVNAGSENPDIEDVNGKYESNGSAISTLPITRVVKEYNIVSPYKSGPYEIEILRINLDGKTTTDSNSDNSVYNLWVDNLINAVQQVLLSFIASENYIVFPSSPRIKIGAVFTVTGSVSNDRTYTVVAVVDEGATQTVYTDQTISVSEPTITVTVTFISGLVYLLKREAYSLLEINGDPNLLTDTIFNMRYTPRRIRDAHNRWIRSMLFGFDSEKVKVVSGNRNITLKTTLAATTVDEDSDVVIGTLGERIFKPFYFDFTTEVPIDLVDLMEANPNRCFRFTIDGFEYTGFSMKTGLAPNTLTPQQFKLLSTDLNDMEEFIV